MAKKPDGAAAGTQRVTFTKPAAERIGKVVRTVEAGNRDQGPLTFRSAAGAGGPQSQRIIVTMKQIDSSESIVFGHAVEFSLDMQSQAALVPPQWPPIATTFDSMLSSMSDSQKTFFSRFTGPKMPDYKCRLVKDVTGFIGDIDFFPNIGVAVANSVEDESGAKTVKVCVSGPALAFVRYLFQFQFSSANSCAIRPRLINDVPAPYKTPLGFLDAHRGGNIRLVHAAEFQQPASFPVIVLTPVML